MTDVTDVTDGTDGVECVIHQDCLDKDFCTKDLCIDGACTAEAASCDNLSACTNDTCNALVGCIHTFAGGAGCVASTDLFSATFDTGALEGMVVANAAPVPDEDAVIWQPDPSQTLAGAGALYLGVPGLYHYDNGKLVAASATTPSVSLPAGKAAKLVFWVWLDVEDGSDWDVLTVSVLTGTKVLPVWAKGDGTIPMETWTQIEVDLTAFAGSEIQLQLNFNSVDSTFNMTTGVFVDELAVSALSSGKGCTKDADCDDSIACTEDTCAGGTCAYVVGDSCCVTASDCFDADSCTLDICGSDSTCQNIPVANPACCNTDVDCVDNNDCTHDICQSNNICDNSVKNEPGCCTKTSECNDGDKCTIDSCKDSICQNYNTCCMSDAECDDGDDVCTNDSCIDGKCKYAYKPIAGCCTPMLYDENFEVGAGDWTFTGSSGTCKWQVLESGKSKSPPGALYYGNPAAMNYNCSKNNGEAQSGEISLPDKSGLSLEFDAYFHVEGGTYDDILVYIVDESGKKTQVIKKSGMGAQKTWNHSKISLNAFKGKTIKIRIEFATKDSIANSTEGVYFDNIQVTDPCGE